MTRSRPRAHSAWRAALWVAIVASAAAGAALLTTDADAGALLLLTALVLAAPATAGRRSP